MHSWVRIEPDYTSCGQHVWLLLSRFQWFVSILKDSLVPRLLLTKPGKLPISFWFQYFEITVTSRQLDCDFKNDLVNSEPQRQPMYLVVLLKEKSLVYIHSS